MLLRKTDVRNKTPNCYNNDEAQFLMYGIVIEKA